MRKNRYLVLAVALALGAWGCDDNNDEDAGPVGTDAGPVGTDGGVDAGGTPTDAGTDAGPPEMDAGPMPTFQIRLANNLPGLTGTTTAPGGFHVCLYFATDGVVNELFPPRFLTESVGPVPFRGVSPPLTFPVIAPLDYVVALYEPANLGDPAGCPTDPNAMGAPAAALIQTMTPADVPENAFVTGVVTGLLPDTFTATGGALPSICNPAAAAPNFVELCTTQAEMVVIQDDRTPAAAGMARFRVSNMVSNSAPAGFSVCYDPGLVPMADGTCVDSTPTDTDEEVLASMVGYGTVSDYSDRTEIVPTGVPAAGAGGGLYLALGPACPDFTTAVAAMAISSSCYPIIAAFPPRDPLPPLPDNVRPQLNADTLNTIFISGALQLGPRDPTPEGDFGPSFFIWQDDL